MENMYINTVTKNPIDVTIVVVSQIFYDLVTEKDFKIPTQPERRERALQMLAKKRQKPIVLSNSPKVL